MTIIILGKNQWKAVCDCQAAICTMLSALLVLSGVEVCPLLIHTIKLPHLLVQLHLIPCTHLDEGEAKLC